MAEPARLPEGLLGSPATDVDLGDNSSGVENLVRDLSLGWERDRPGGALFLVGAGCSASAGVPLGSQIAREAACLLFEKYSREQPTEPDTALEWLKGKGFIDTELQWHDSYYSLFAEISRNRELEVRLIRGAIDRAKNKTNWAHICLGELVAQGFVHTVLTTNFDQLVLDGMVRAGILPVVADGIEALDRISSRPDHPQLVHLHGSRHSYRLS